LGLATFQFFLGHGLRTLKPWTRIPVAILSGLGMINIPIGTLFGGYILYLMLSEKGKIVFSEDYRRIIDATPHVKYRTPVLVLILGVLLILMIGIGVFVAVHG